MPRASQNRIFDYRLVIVAGKGGVGKSTLATAIALAAARSGRRTLLYQYGPYGKQISTPLSDQLIGDTIVELDRNLFAVRPSTEHGMREYVLMRLRSKRAYNLVFENALVKKLIAAIPGVNELIWLGKAFNHERERNKDGSPVWDTIVLDPPATGHSLYLFQVPFVVKSAVPAGPFHKDASDMVDLLQDPTRTAMHLLTLPEEMPVNETIELRQNINKSTQMPVVSLIVNGVFSPIFDDTDVGGFKELRTAVPEDGLVLDRLVGAALFRNERYKLQQRYLHRLRKELGLPTIEIPYYFVPELNRTVLEKMAAHIANFKPDERTAEPAGAEV